MHEITLENANQQGERSLMKWNIQEQNKLNTANPEGRAVMGTALAQDGRQAGRRKGENEQTSKEKMDTGR